MFEKKAPEPLKCGIGAEVASLSKPGGEGGVGCGRGAGNFGAGFLRGVRRGR